MTSLGMMHLEDSAEKELLHLETEIQTGSRKEILADFRRGIQGDFREETQNNPLSRESIRQPVLAAESNVKSHLNLEVTSQYTAAPVSERREIKNQDVPDLLDQQTVGLIRSIKSWIRS